MYWFFLDIKLDVLHNFLQLKNIDVNIISKLDYWGSSTNQCIHRDTINGFVDWYFPSYDFIKTNHYQKLPYYHERLFAIYLKSINMDNLYIPDILRHYSIKSHIKYE